MYDIEIYVFNEFLKPEIFEDIYQVVELKDIKISIRKGNKIPEEKYNKIKNLENYNKILQTNIKIFHNKEKKLELEEKINLLIKYLEEKNCKLIKKYPIYDAVMVEQIPVKNKEGQIIRYEEKKIPTKIKNDDRIILELITKN